MYGSEVWSICDKDDDETQIQFCKVWINSVQMLHAEMNLDDYHWRE